ncbi:hypothetical protein SAMN05443549_10159 [Flavobacterium fluvii]|uniref:Uncharacterized protein n=1 Tax=Flavobacterium fluvii TaxID=468056 RepID=A0A1M5DSV1_9FLAO|nr:hypothetical protein [Flavobacterium fluvii]SHF70005.1 hypothetical protein SAMN05443549_10159 [Flavobacterium fluvii]
MKTLKYISNTFRFLKGPNTTPKTNTNNGENIELTNNRFGFNLERAPTSRKAKKSLLALLYSEENNTLFI